MAFARNIMMGDPSGFAILKGANPHTRNLLGLRKWVRLKEARAQWEQMALVLADHDVNIHVIPPHPRLPGLVFPANAGVMLGVEQEIPLERREFILSRLGSARGEETHVYRKFLNNLGVVTHEVSRQFEGEADLVPWGNRYIFTYGKVMRQHFAFRFGFPPWKRIYGFRSEQAVMPELFSHLEGKEIIKCELVQEAFYHGDTVLCTLGVRRDILMIYPSGLKDGGQSLLSEPGDVIMIPDRDAWNFAANSFQIIRKGQCILFLPQGVSRKLIKSIEGKGIECIQIDVSEFFTKGGGSVKCMIGDLGRG